MGIQEIGCTDVDRTVFGLKYRYLCCESGNGLFLGGGVY